jgi:hypothetical protein
MNNHILNLDHIERVCYWLSKGHDLISARELAEKAIPANQDGFEKMFNKIFGEPLDMKDILD